MPFVPVKAHTLLAGTRAAYSPRVREASRDDDAPRVFALGSSAKPRDLAFDPEAWPKIARLHQAKQAGTEVPDGVAVRIIVDDPDRERNADAATGPDPLDAIEAALAWALERWQREDPTRPSFLRMALRDEDGSDGSAAGRGLTIAGIDGRPALRDALRALLDHARGLRVEDFAVLLQRRARGRRLAVVAYDREGFGWIEIHPAGTADRLDAGHSPLEAMALVAWTRSEGNGLETLIDRLGEQLDEARAPHGLDLELALPDPDASGAIELLQLRPLAAPLVPGWSAFRALCHGSARREGRALPEWPGRWLLDAEHNPAPLSYAHACLLDRLRAARPGRAGDPEAFVGWLYVRQPVRELAAPTGSQPAARADARDARAPSAPLPFEVLERLVLEWIPRGEAVLTEFTRALDPMSERADLERARAEADAAFLSMIDLYLGQLVPARRSSSERAVDPERPLSTRVKARYAHYLPATWDLDSPSLAELDPRLATTRDAGATGERRPGENFGASSEALREAIADCESTARALTLLEELDDILFALGLAPLRAWYLGVAARLGWSTAEAFECSPEELLAALDDGHARIELRARAAERAQTRAAASRLSPPLMIADGHPVLSTASAGRDEAQLAAAGWGSPFEGPLAQRTDLQALVADPAPSASIVCIPALTAPAALALHRAGVRAVCTEFGGALSHGSLVARELGLSALIGRRGCTALEDGARARLDPRTRRLSLLAGSEDPS